jgi:hypothetical protein
MALRSAAEIRIGGHIATIAALDQFIEAAESDGAGLDWDGTVTLGRDDLAANILQAAVERQHLYFNDLDARGGQFEELQDAAAHLGLTWHLADDGCVGAWQPSNWIWRPGYATHVEIGGSSETGPMLSLEQLQDWLIVGVEELALQVSAHIATFAPVPPITLADEVRDEIMRRIAPDSQECVAVITQRIDDLTQEKTV